MKFFLFFSLCFVHYRALAWASGTPQDPIHIAVAPLHWSPPLSDGNFIRNKAQADNLTNAVRAYLTTQLNKQHKFEVLERQQFSSVMGELERMYFSDAFTDSKGTNSAEYGQLKGVKYLILGNITQFGKMESNIGAKGLGRDKTSLLMVIDLRLVDVESGTVRYADSVETTVVLSKSLKLQSLFNGLRRQGNLDNSKGSYVAEGVLNGNEGIGTTAGEAGKVEELVRTTADSIIRILVPQMVPIAIVQCQNDAVLLNHGNGLLKEGHVLEVFKETGESLIDPETGQSLGSSTIFCGKLQVYRTQEKMSWARPFEGSDIGAFSYGDRCEIVGVEKVRSKKRSRKH